ncbi:MAG: GAF domain-containing protein, partial [Betaproteobacteria bacterium]
NILNGDNGFDQVINENGDTITLNDGNTDASLTPYHVERGKLFIEQRQWHPDLDKQLLKDLISCTQFPIPERGAPSGDLDNKFQELADLVGSSDLIGQLADPMYDVKMPRLFHEFNETGAAQKMGISNPVELRNNYPNFYINLVKPHIGKALHYLGVTDEGQAWVASLNYHVFSQTHRQVLEKGGIDLLNEITKLDVQNYRTDELILEILKRVCVFKRWPIGHAYVVQRNDREALLKSTGVWHSEVTGESFEEFKKISEEYVFYPGEGLPGQAYEKQSVQTIYDVTKDANFPRAALAKTVSVRGAFAFPIKDDLGVRWVLEFFSPEPELLDPSFLELMDHVATHINQGFSGR